MSGNVGKFEQIRALAEKGLSYAAIAEAVYGEATEKTINRVSVAIWKLRRRGLLGKVRRKIFLRSYLTREVREYRERYRQLLKIARKAEKSGRRISAGNWHQQDKLAQRLADECYRRAKELMAEGEIEYAAKFMDLVAKFLRLSHLAKKEYDLEEAKKILEKLREEREAEMVYAK